jgi:hypothetical protein
MLHPAEIKAMLSAAKVKQVQGQPAGAVVARGEAEIGFQQISELLLVPRVDRVDRYRRMFSLTLGRAVNSRA